MKPSPLQLNWVHYVSASFELLEPSPENSPASPLSVSVEPELQYRDGGEHYVVVSIKTKEANRGIYNVAVEAVAGFGFDLEIARREYRPRLAPALATVIAVNVARIVYASAREYIASMTARAPFGAALLESVLLEPGDVKITSEKPQAELLASLFAATEAEVQQYMGRGQTGLAAGSAARPGIRKAGSGKRKGSDA